MRTAFTAGPASYYDVVNPTSARTAKEATRITTTPDEEEEQGGVFPALDCHYKVYPHAYDSSVYSPPQATSANTDEDFSGGADLQHNHQNSEYIKNNYNGQQGAKDTATAANVRTAPAAAATPAPQHVAHQADVSPSPSRLEESELDLLPDLSDDNWLLIFQFLRPDELALKVPSVCKRFLELGYSKHLWADAVEQCFGRRIPVKDQHIAREVFMKIVTDDFFRVFERTSAEHLPKTAECVFSHIVKHFFHESRVSLRQTLVVEAPNPDADGLAHATVRHLCHPFLHDNHVLKMHMDPASRNVMFVFKRTPFLLSTLLRSANAAPLNPQHHRCISSLDGRPTPDGYYQYRELLLALQDNNGTLPDELVKQLEHWKVARDQVPQNELMAEDDEFQRFTRALRSSSCSSSSSWRAGPLVVGGGAADGEDVEEAGEETSCCFSVRKHTYRRTTTITMATKKKINMQTFRRTSRNNCPWCGKKTGDKTGKMRHRPRNRRRRPRGLTEQIEEAERVAGQRQAFEGATTLQKAAVQNEFPHHDDRMAGQAERETTGRNAPPRLVALAQRINPLTNGLTPLTIKAVVRDVLLLLHRLHSTGHGHGNLDASKVVLCPDTGRAVELLDFFFGYGVNKKQAEKLAHDRESLGISYVKKPPEALLSPHHGAGPLLTTQEQRQQQQQHERRMRQIMLQQQGVGDGPAAPPQEVDHDHDEALAQRPAPVRPVGGAHQGEMWMGPVFAQMRAGARQPPEEQFEHVPRQHADHDRQNHQPPEFFPHLTFEEEQWQAEQEIAAVLEQERKRFAAAPELTATAQNLHRGNRGRRADVDDELQNGHDAAAADALPPVDDLGFLDGDGRAATTNDDIENQTRTSPSDVDSNAPPPGHAHQWIPTDKDPPMAADDPERPANLYTGGKEVSEMILEVELGPRNGAGGLRPLQRTSSAPAAKAYASGHAKGRRDGSSSRNDQISTERTPERPQGGSSLRQPAGRGRRPNVNVPWLLERVTGAAIWSPTVGTSSACESSSSSSSAAPASTSLATAGAEASDTRAAGGKGGASASSSGGGKSMWANFGSSSKTNHPRTTASSSSSSCSSSTSVPQLRPAAKNKVNIKAEHNPLFSSDLWQVGLLLGTLCANKIGCSWVTLWLPPNLTNLVLDSEISWIFQLCGLLGTPTNWSNIEARQFPKFRPCALFADHECPFAVPEMKRYFQQQVDEEWKDEELAEMRKQSTSSVREKLKAGVFTPEQQLFIHNLGADAGVDLLQRLLQMNPEERIGIQEALQHPYFDDLKKIEGEIATASLNMQRPPPPQVENRDQQGGPLMDSLCGLVHDFGSCCCHSCRSRGFIEFSE
eukprot:g14533.t1